MIVVNILRVLYSWSANCGIMVRTAWKGKGVWRQLVPGPSPVVDLLHATRFASTYRLLRGLPAPVAQPITDIARDIMDVGELGYYRRKLNVRSDG